MDGLIDYLLYVGLCWIILGGFWVWFYFVFVILRVFFICLGVFWVFVLMFGLFCVDLFWVCLLVGVAGSFSFFVVWLLLGYFEFGCRFLVLILLLYVLLLGLNVLNFVSTIIWQFRCVVVCGLFRVELWIACFVLFCLLVLL